MEYILYITFVSLMSLGVASFNWGNFSVSWSIPPHARVSAWNEKNLHLTSLFYLDFSKSIFFAKITKMTLLTINFKSKPFLGLKCK